MGTPKPKKIISPKQRKAAKRIVPRLNKRPRVGPAANVWDSLTPQEFTFETGPDHGVVEWNIETFFPIALA